MNTEWHFPIMIAASLVEMIGVLWLVLGGAELRRRLGAVLAVSAVVVILGMCFGKYGVRLGLPWWIYYPVPALLTVVLPPVVFRLTGRRLALYLILAALSAPLIHALFAVFLGWHEYMPFLHLPSLVG